MPKMFQGIALYSLPEVSKIFGLEVQTIRRMIQENRLEYVIHGKRPYVPQAVIEEYKKINNISTYIGE